MNPVGRPHCRRGGPVLSLCACSDDFSGGADCAAAKPVPPTLSAVLRNPVRTPPMSTQVAILGSGAMATACSILLTDHPGTAASLWVRNEEHCRELQADRENRRLLPGVPIPPQVRITSSLESAIDGADLLLAAIPTKFLRETLVGIAGHLTRNRPVISVVKGIENDTFLRPSQIIEETLGSRAVVALSGPSHAEEIARRLPASVVAASGDVALARQVQRMFSTDRFRVYTNQDLIGVELAGALKNVIALAAGILDGLRAGDNAKAALVTRGLVEITRLGVALGARPETFGGLAGVGDLFTTCVSPHGRNRSAGERIGQGVSPEQVVAESAAVIEGIPTTRAVLELAARLKVEMPITQAVAAVLFDHKAPLVAITELMNRPPKAEDRP